MSLLGRVSVLAPLALLACLDAATPSGVDTAPASPRWTDTVEARIEADVAQIRPVAGGFRAYQPLMGMAVAFDERGVVLSAGRDRVTMSLLAWGRDDAMLEIWPVAPGIGGCSEATTLDGGCAPQLEYERGELLEWWSSVPGRVENGWDVAAPAAGHGALGLRLLVEGAELLRVDDGSVRLVGQERVFTHADLFATDAHGAALDAWFEVDGNELLVRVDDSTAAYPIHIDPVTYTAAWSDTSSTSYRLGYSVAGAGDVNNDGYDDIAVGAAGDSSSVGRVYVFHGSASGLDPAPATTIAGAAAAMFGAAVRGAGDVNGDGYDDLVVGAYNASSYQGAAYVYHGSASGISSTAARSLSASGGYYGYSVAGAGDVNGDGYADIAIGAPYRSSYYGAVYVYLGSSTGIPSSASTTITGGAYDYLGMTVTGGGDQNGDGYDDIAASATDEVNVYCGGSGSFSSTACVTLTAPASGVGYGLGSDFAGDLNADGYDDFIVGYNSSSASSVYIHMGTSTGLTPTSTTSLSGSSSSYFGSRTAGVGDINGDGYDDIAIGAYLGSGSVKVYQGSASGLDTTYIGSVSGSSLSSLGWDIDAAGDVNRDGYDDFIAGAPGSYSTSSGAAYVYQGTLDADGDGYYPGSGTADDCDDTDENIHPGATETTGDEVDYNCDGAETCYDDDDNDGYLDTTADTRSSTDTDCDDSYEGSSGDPTTDCSDASSTRYPGATETVGDGIDQDCDNYDACYDDDDNDGYLDTSGDTRANNDSDCTDSYEGTSTDATTDCDDSSSSIRPGATETTGDEVDYNCDGAETCYEDDDDDGFLDTTGDTRSSSDTDCDDAYEGSSSDLTTDCADSSAARYPGNTETVGDGVDGDCTSTEVCYDDDDNDGYLDTAGDTRTSTDTDCADSYEGLNTEPTTDCDDTSSSIRPGATESTGDGVDRNCDGAETCYDDDDDDGYLDTANDTRASSDTDCDDAYEGVATDLTTDCDDESASVRPGATETVADGVDQDCDGAELCYDDDDDDGYLDTSGDTRASTDSDCSDAYEALATAATTDCDDTSASLSPGATERTGDEVDSDCDGAETCYDDDDNDGYLDGSGDTRASSDADCDDAGEGRAGDPETDCDDADASRSPAATEATGDEIDQDCDGAETCLADGDGDGYLDSSGATVASTDSDCADVGEASTAATTGDCDGALASVYPGAPETVADGVDQDCDGGDVCHVDADGDDHGGTEVVTSTDLDCTDSGESESADDCDESDALAYPGAAETLADGVDQDCDGGDACYIDADRDGQGGANTVASADLDCTDGGEATSSTDCDDEASATYAGAPEVVADGIDQDCDGGESCYFDVDGDAHGDTSTVASADLACDGAYESAASDDCNAALASVYPGAPELGGDGVDQDCDGLESCFIDGDLDGVGGTAEVQTSDFSCSGTGQSSRSDDCDDADAARFPGATELPADGIDADCDDAEACYTDADADGFGNAESTELSAVLGCGVTGVSADPSDCDDGNALAYPAAPEREANGIDEDCDGSEVCFVDADGDAHGTESTTLGNLACEGGGAAPNSDDCDDAEASVYPGAEELVADGIDEDCDGDELCHADEDGDGFGGAESVASANLACEDGGESGSSNDCDDADASVFPAAEESCNGIDDDCNGEVDDGLSACDAEDTGAVVASGECSCSSSGTSSALLLLLATPLLARRRAK